MAKILSVTDAQVNIGLDDGELLKVERTSLTFTPSIGDAVEIFRNEEQTLVTKTNSTASNNSVNVGQKGKLAAGLLGIFLGGIGVHSFYLGKAGRGVAQIFVTIFTLGIGSLWGFIEGIVILCSRSGSNWHKDAYGNELID